MGIDGDIAGENTGTHSLDDHVHDTGDSFVKKTLR